MEAPCCRRVSELAIRAIELAKRKIQIETITISLEGNEIGRNRNFPTSPFGTQRVTC